MTETDHHTAIEKNFAFFQSKLPELMRDHGNRYALLRDEKIIALYDTSRDADLTGAMLFKDDLYSIQKVTQTPVNLGIFSCAGFASHP